VGRADFNAQPAATASGSINFNQLEIPPNMAWISVTDKEKSLCISLYQRERFMNKEKSFCMSPRPYKGPRAGSLPKGEGKEIASKGDWIPDQVWNDKNNIQ
jgi:hypothetical protein